MTILETKNLIKAFEGVRAVDDLSLAVNKGQIISIIGPNGSGKSTLVNVLSGMLAIDGGVVLVGGNKLEKIIPYEVPGLGLTRTFQEVRLFEQMTVLDNIVVVLTERDVFESLFEQHTGEHLKKAESVLKVVGLLEKKDALARNLSYGQRKLLEVARVLAMDSDVILLDEPFAGLFKEMIKVVVGIIKEMKSEGKTIILIEHNMDLIRELSDYVFVMDSGQLLAEGKPEEVLAKPEVIEAYLGQ